MEVEQYLVLKHLEIVIFQNLIPVIFVNQLRIIHIFTLNVFFLNTFDWIRMTSRCNTKYCAYDNENNAGPHVILLSVDSKIKLKRSFIVYLY